MSTFHIPADILAAAKADFSAPPVTAFLANIIKQYNVPSGTSPADYPEPVWSVFKQLREAWVPAGSPREAGSVLNTVAALVLSETDRAYLAGVGDPADREIQALIMIEERANA